MKYYVQLDTRPDSETYQEAMSLHRWDLSENALIMDRYDPQTGQWIDNPAIIRLTGTGGSNDFWEISEQEAEALLRDWAKKFSGERSVEVVGLLRRVKRHEEADESKEIQDG